MDTSRRTLLTAGAVLVGLGCVALAVAAELRSSFVSMMGVFVTVAGVVALLLAVVRRP